MIERGKGLCFQLTLFENTPEKKGVYPKWRLGLKSVLPLEIHPSVFPKGWKTTFQSQTLLRNQFPLFQILPDLLDMLDFDFQ